MNHVQRNRRVLASTLIGCVAFAIGLVGCASTGQHAETRALLADEGVIEGASAIVVVDGMGCPMCATSVERAFRSMPGVLSSRIDLEEGEVTVMLTGSPRVTRGQLAKAVHDAGFSVRDVRVP